MPFAKSRVLIVALSPAAFLIGSFHVWSQTTSTQWQGAPGELGDWFDEKLWSVGTPTASHQAFVSNGGQIVISSRDAQAKSLRLSASRTGSPNVVHRGGRLQVATALSIAQGAYELAGGSVDGQELLLGAIGFNLSQTGRTIDGTLESTELPVEQGVLSENPGQIVFIGNGRFELENGTARFVDVSITGGQLEIAGGLFDAGELFIDQVNTILGNDAVAQSDGVVNVSGEVQIQNGIYRISGGSLAAERLAIGDPIENRPSAFLRRGVFQQSGGSVRLNQNLELCIPLIVDLPDTPPIFPRPVFETVVYEMSAGDLEVGGDLVVGSRDQTPARFVQTGGATRVAGVLRISGLGSQFDFSGGAFDVDEIAVGSLAQGGALVLGPAANLTVRSRIELGELAELHAAPGTHLRIDGAEIQIRGNQPDLLSGLENLSLLIDGPDTSTLEAPSADLGPIGVAFERNFAWDEIFVNGEVGSTLQLVNAVANQQPNEAVYVDRLVVGVGATLDVGDVNVYYRSAEIAGRILSTGGVIAAVAPEPAAAYLLLFGASQLWIMPRSLMRRASPFG